MNQIRSWNRQRKKRDLIRRAEQWETYAFVVEGDAKSKVAKIRAKALALRSRAAGL